MELQYLSELGFDFDLSLTGFDLPEIDLLIENLDTEADDPSDKLPELSGGPAVTRPGDVWLIGQHRLICGDATQNETYQKLLGKERAQMVFTDPPYNVKVDGHILLSFAQFEREVIGERVRDKIAASKKRGMWMGGMPPLGYDIRHRKLVINASEAAVVKEIFERYLATESGDKVALLLNDGGHYRKCWINAKGDQKGGEPFNAQAIYKILRYHHYIDGRRMASLWPDE